MPHQSIAAVYFFHSKNYKSVLFEEQRIHLISFYLILFYYFKVALQEFEGIQEVDST